MIGSGLAALAGLLGRRRPRDWGDESWWAILAVVVVVALLKSPSFFDHYPNFAAPPLTLCVGVAVGAATSLAAKAIPGPLSRRTADAAATGIAAALLIPLGFHGIILTPEPVPNLNAPRVAASVERFDCVFTPYAYLGIVSDSLSRSMDHGCGSIVDLFGARVVEGSSDTSAVGVIPARTATERQQLEQLAVAQAVVVKAIDQYAGLPPAVVAEIRNNFLLTTISGNVQVWVRR